MLVLTEAWWRRGNTFASHCYGLGSTQTTAMHTPCHAIPCHTCPPAMHPPPCIPPAMQTPPLPCHPSPAKYTPLLPCTPPYRGGSSLSCMVGGMHGGGHECWGGGGLCGRGMHVVCFSPFTANVWWISLRVFFHPQKGSKLSDWNHLIRPTGLARTCSGRRKIIIY